MIRLYSIIGVMMVTFISTLAVVRGLSRVSESSAAAILRQGADQCPGGRKNCLNGIWPGQTTIDQAAAILNADSTFRPDGEFDLCWASNLGGTWHICLEKDGSGIVNTIIIVPPWAALRLGEAIVMFGQPIKSILCNPAYASLGTLSHIQGGNFVGGVLYFGKGVTVLAYNPWQPRALGLTPNMVILRLYYFLDSSGSNDAQGFPWIGFSRKTKQTGCGL